MSSTRSIKNFILSELRNRGVSATKDGVAKLVELAKATPQEQVQEAMEELLDAAIKEELPSGVIDGEIIDKVSITMEGEDSGDPGSNTVIISAFDVPSFKFNQTKRVFQELNAETQKRFAPAAAKTAMSRERYLLIEQRLLRHHSFTKPFAVTAKVSEEYYQLTRIEGVQGCGRGVKYILGMISQPNPGKFTMEDLTGTIPIDISKAETTVGYFTENSVILAVGQMDDGVFNVSMFGLPPAETKETTRMALGPHIDFFGEASKTLDVSRLEVMEREATDVMFAFLSDVQLDRPQVLDKLEMIFKGFDAGTVPTLFVLSGAFTSRPVGQGGESLESYSSYFGHFAQIISKYPNVATQSHFVFVPSSTDPGVGHFTPRPPLPNIFIKEFENVMPEGSFTFTSNPCRIRYYSQEITVGRDNYMHEMRRHCVLKPSEESADAPTHLMHTLLSQSHICPLPNTSRPILWDHDAAMRLYPLPDLLVLCDQHEVYTKSHEGCQVVNPGPFHTDFSFLVYYPAGKNCETSCI